MKKFIVFNFGMYGILVDKTEAEDKEEAIEEFEDNTSNSFAINVKEAKDLLKRLQQILKGE